ncbi:MAG TPA: signal peptidase I, partial [Symbiobacteriaceae bacterium]|nr:signal peptidase I [Symbiobacteriaceae bacterium]
TWLLVAGSVAIIAGGLTGRPILLASVPTKSMVPVLQPGDLIPVVPLFGVELEHGQVIVFKTEGDTSWIVHRIVGGDEHEGFVTKGDANNLADPNRVFPRHVAGTVPIIGSRVVRIPRLGMLSLERSPLSNPLVAGLALILGTYLLASDAGAGFRRVRLAKLRRIRVTTLNGRTALGVYVALAVAVFAVTLMSTWGLSSQRLGTYKVLETQSTKVQVKNVYTMGTEVKDPVTLKNPSAVPLVIGLESSDPQVRWEPDWLILQPHEQREITLSIDAAVPGDYSVRLRQSVYLPLLPVQVLQILSGIGWYVPMFAEAFELMLVVVVVAVSDVRVLLHLRSVSSRIFWRLLGRRGLGA